MSHRVCVGMLALRNMCAEDTGDRELRTQKEQQIASTRAVTCSKVQRVFTSSLAIRCLVSRDPF